MKEKQTIFRFKQFSVANEKSAMRVGTDGVLLGAWTPVTEGPCTIWDAGAGTGMISLMLAQRMAEARIIAIEIDPTAETECRANIESSPWRERITTAPGNILEIAPRLPKPDMIVSNPPFFANGVQAPDKSRAVARHASSEGSLSPTALIELAGNVLGRGGRLSMITPADQEEEIVFAATLAKMTPREITEVATSPGKTPKRILWLLEKESTVEPLRRSRLTLRGEKTERSDEFARLTKDFYLDRENQ